MTEVMLNLLGLLGVTMLTLLAAWGGFALLTRLLWRFGRKNVAACATRIAETLALKTIASPDARMLLWHGPIPGGEMWLATGASYIGPTDLPLDPTGPGFADGMPCISFQRLCSLLLVVRYARPLPVAFTATTAYGVNAGFRTGDVRFDQSYKLNGTYVGADAPLLADTEVSAAKQFFANTAVRDDLLGIIGPDCRATFVMPRFGANRKRGDTGVVVSMNEQAMVVYWSSPEEKFAAEFGLAVVKAVSTLDNVQAREEDP
jgi:hypothetical protein